MSLSVIIPIIFPSLSITGSRRIYEADFFPPGQQADARDVSERYIGKSHPIL
jgi:hypothetical protein